MRILAPAYGYPGTNRVLWEELARASAVMGHVIINPSSGPGDVRDSAWTAQVSVLAEQGIPMLGYLNLDYSSKPVGDLLAEAARWHRWYGIVDFFLDCAPSSDVRRTGQVAEILRLAGRAGELVANAGTRTTPDVARHFDAVVEHEGAPPFGGTDPGLALVSRAESPGAKSEVGRSWIVYGADRAAARVTLEAAAAHGVEEVWITDLRGRNPYRHLPSYWPWLVEVLGQHGRQ